MGYGRNRDWSWSDDIDIDGCDSNGNRVTVDHYNDGTYNEYTKPKIDFQARQRNESNSMEKTDFELLKLAAFAAGMTYDEKISGKGGLIAWDENQHYGMEWNPISDDYDAMRLSAKLKISIEYPNPMDLGGGFLVASFWRVYRKYKLDHDISCTEKFSDDPAAAARKAVTRVAAEVGRAMLPPDGSNPARREAMRA